jgi:hypothetical protein
VGPTCLFWLFDLLLFKRYILLFASPLLATAEAAGDGRFRVIGVFGDVGAVRHLGRFTIVNVGV